MPECIVTIPNNNAFEQVKKLSNSMDNYFPFDNVFFIDINEENQDALKQIPRITIEKPGIAYQVTN